LGYITGWFKFDGMFKSDRVYMGIPELLASLHGDKKHYRMWPAIICNQLLLSLLNGMSRMGGKISEAYFAYTYPTYSPPSPSQ
jgi:hypothetical protein